MLYMYIDPKSTRPHETALCIGENILVGASGPILGWLSLGPYKSGVSVVIQAESMVIQAGRDLWPHY